MIERWRSDAGLARNRSSQRKEQVLAALRSVAFVLVFGVTAAAGASVSLEQWRRDVERVRALAENDAPLAYQEAQRLEAALPAGAPGADRSRALNLLARTETYLGYTEQASEHARLAFDVAERSGDAVGQAEADLSLALNSINQGRLDELSFLTTHSVAALAGAERPDLMAEALFQTTLMHRRFDQLDDSVATAMQAMEIAQRAKDPRALIYAHLALGISFDQSERRAEARQHFLEVRRQARAAGYKRLEADATLRMGGTLQADGDLREAERLQREAIATFREIGLPFAVNFSLVNLAYCLREQGRYGESRRLLDGVIAAYESQPNPIGLWHTLISRSQTSQRMGDMTAALADAERASSVADTLAIPLYLSQAAQRVAAVRAATGDFRRAYELSAFATDMNEKATRERTSLRTVELARRFELERKQQQILDLTHRTEQQALALRQQTLQQRWMWTVLGGSVAMLAITSFFLRRLRRSHRLIRNLNTDLEKRVQERTAQLQSANAELEAFSYSVSHDLRAPLRGIEAYSRMLLDGYASKLDDKAHTQLRNICVSTRRMAQIIDDLMVLARAGSSEVLQTTIDLTQLAQEVADELQRSAADRKVLFVIEPHIEAHADARLMRIVLENLLGNAWKFTSKQSQARIDVGRVRDASVPTFFVRDNGVGFDPHLAAKIFDAFVRLHSAAEFPGTGIGLATVRRIVYRHGGQIWTQSTPGEGATFYFTLPD